MWKWLRVIRDMLPTKLNEDMTNVMIISSYFNPKNNPHRTKAFWGWYAGIKHLPHRITETVYTGQTPITEGLPNAIREYTNSLLWNKEAVLNKMIKELPDYIKYVFWLDTDLIFLNDDWLRDSVDLLRRGASAVQPFTYAVHLEKDESHTYATEEDFAYLTVHKHRDMFDPKYMAPQKVWRSFCSNSSVPYGLVAKATDDLIEDLPLFIEPIGQSELCKVEVDVASHANYHTHGHVGFAWGARRALLDGVGLYDKALVGGADHIMAHAMNSEEIHPCIKKAHEKDMATIMPYTQKMYQLFAGELGAAKGTVLHIWHGDLEKRDYLKRIQDTTGWFSEVKPTHNGLYEHTQAQQIYLNNYWDHREDVNTEPKGDYQGGIS